ncbi:MAG: hypothetical protein Q9195_008754, partial [Heterodermia aff. obscurata]
SLPRTHPTPLTHLTPYWSLNETLSNDLWSRITTAQGMVALPHTFTDRKALPRGAAFPWDATKSVYFLQVYHQLHCLVRMLSPKDGAQGD